MKGKGIRFFSGPKNWGQVVSKEAKLGQYDPKSVEINFAVPDKRYLRCQDRRFGKLIQPGIMKDSLRILQDHPDVVLMADCKRLSKGLKGECLGDIDLWSHEGPPTLEDKLQELEHHKRIISEGIEFLEDQLDRQSIRISKRFFSEEVEAVLNKNGDKKEANFVHLVRDWYEACDERGIHIHERLRSMEKFFRFLRGKVDWNACSNL